MELKTKEPQLSNIQRNFPNSKPVVLPFGKTIYQFNDNHHITSDTTFLIETILENASSKKLNVLEIGSGNGIISIMLALHYSDWKITGIDIQPDLVKLAEQNARSAAVNPKFLTMDLRTTKFSANFFDLIVSNPPYFRSGGKLNPDISKAISRHELLCTMPDIFECIDRNLTSNGKAFVIYPLNRSMEIEKNIKKVDLKISKKFISESKKGKEKIILEISKISK